MTYVTATDVRSFSDLGVSDDLVEALANSGITDPFPIQELSLPMALAGADLIGQARTGTGKTLAFGIPLVQRVDVQAGYTEALVVVPTRELCLQVHDDLVIAGATRDVKVVAAYGGRAIDPQSEAIAAGAPIVVGTPGRLLDLVRRRLLDLSRVTMLVLDEADEMLDMGFLPDVEQLIEKCAPQRQTLLFSATVPSDVVKLARRYMNKPTFMRSEVQQRSVAPQMRQFFFACHRLDKPAVVARILASPNRGRTIVFTRTKRMADVLASELRSRDIDAGVIHSDLRQEARERALVRFRKGTHDVLCATEVAARGLDIDQVTHVINYDCPDDERMYLHRIGRTGRAGAAGVAVTLAVWNELARLEMIKKALQITDETHEVFSTSPLLDDLFGSVDRPGTGMDDAPDERASVTHAAVSPSRDATAPASAQRRQRPRRRRRSRRRGLDAAPYDERTAHDTVSVESASDPDAQVDRDEAASDDAQPPSADQTPDTTQARDSAQPPSAERTPDTAQPPSTEQTPEDAHEPDDAPTSGEPSSAGRRRGRGGGDTGRQRDSSGRSDRSDRSGDDRSGRDGATRPSRDSATRSVRDGSGRSGRGTPSRSRQPDGGTTRADQPVSPAGRSARGTGKPTLQRPLAITHLP